MLMDYEFRKLVPKFRSTPAEVNEVYTYLVRYVRNSDDLPLLMPGRRRRLAVPTLETQTFQVNQSLKSSHVIIDHSEILVLHSAADLLKAHCLVSVRYNMVPAICATLPHLNYTCTCMNELQRCISRVNTSRGHDRKTRECAGNS